MQRGRHPCGRQHLAVMDAHIRHVKGVVVDRGGALSHAAIVGREYGIPVVMNIFEGTTKLKSGQKHKDRRESGHGLSWGAGVKGRVSHVPVCPVVGYSKGKRGGIHGFRAAGHLPALRGLGLHVIGGFHVIVGAGPRISLVPHLRTFRASRPPLTRRNSSYSPVNSRNYLVNYSSRIFKDTKRVELKTYGIELGTWRFNQHFTLMPGSEKEYADFIGSEYFPVMLKHGHSGQSRVAGSRRLRAPLHSSRGSGPKYSGYREGSGVGRVREGQEFSCVPAMFDNTAAGFLRPRDGLK